MFPHDLLIFAMQQILPKVLSLMRVLINWGFITLKLKICWVDLSTEFDAEVGNFAPLKIRNEAFSSLPSRCLRLLAASLPL